MRLEFPNGSDDPYALTELTMRTAVFALSRAVDFLHKNMKIVYV